MSLVETECTELRLLCSKSMTLLIFDVFVSDGQFLDRP